MVIAEEYHDRSHTKVGVSYIDLPGRTLTKYGHAFGRLVESLGGYLQHKKANPKGARNTWRLYQD